MRNADLVDEENSNPSVAQHAPSPTVRRDTF